ncbi:hypothetical protein DD238_003887 [Peronospora effusa]|uniref:Major facilitator superfamily (MFS) profile domain-containing protein n=1 Tax=Peronospora effusa TaxID=542832 RepID=A0A3M6VFS8_9STRA|nr:hypothetical protein DD238_003887 [Peronospora effusa]
MMLVRSSSYDAARRLGLFAPVHLSRNRPIVFRQSLDFRFTSTQTTAVTCSSIDKTVLPNKPVPLKRRKNKVAKKKVSALAASTVATKDVETLIPKKKVKSKHKPRKLMSQKQIEEEMLARAMKEDAETSASATGSVADTVPLTVSDTVPVTVSGTKKSKQNYAQSTDKTNGSKVMETPVVPLKEPMPLQNLKTEKITMTLQEIAALQKTLPSKKEIAALITKLRRVSFDNAHTLFDLYRNFGNPYLDENFLTPGVLACCEAKKPAEGIRIVRDMLNQGRKVDESTLRTLLTACDEASAAVEVIELWYLMEQAGMKLELADYNRFLDICYRQEYLDGAIKVLKELRLHRSISVHTYMHWLLRASIVWRSDAFFDILMEMRLSEVEPEIMSLTSLESGRKDRALTVMEGVRAVGLDPCFAMSSVFSSMQSSVYRNGPSYMALTSKDIKIAREKFGDLTPIEQEWPVTPIPQVLETQAAGLILQQETFRRLKRQQVNRIDALLQMLPITANMTINLRKQLLRMSLLVNTHRVRRDRETICREYDSGRSLIELSTVHNYPPVSLMRVILRAKGKNQIEIKNALARPAVNLSKRDQQELRKAIEYDSIHKSDPFIGAPKYNADSLEKAIEHYLKAKGIRLKTQSELCTDQIASHGRRVISPDILLLDPVIINGVPIRWIDAKNYYGAHIVSKRLISTQLANYVKEWGPGAIVFGMGYSDMFSLPGVICLDTTPFPKTRKEAAKIRIKSFLYSCLNVFRWKKHLGSELTKKYPGIEDDASMISSTPSWFYLVECLRDPPRSDFAFVPHQYISAPLDRSNGSDLSPSDENTPINSRPDYRHNKKRLASQWNTFFALHLVTMGAASVACAWLTLFPISPRRLYNMQVDIFQARHEHAEFFFHSCLYLGTVLGAAIAGYSGDRLGRAGTLELAAIPFLLGSMLIGVAFGELTVLIGRYLLGAAAGMIHVIVPVYLAEISATHTRGRVICVQNFFSMLGRISYAALGALFMYLSRQYLGFNLSEWKMLALAGLVPALILLLLAQKLPDSPTWLIARHDDREAAFDVLCKLFDRDEQVAEDETNAIIHAQVLAATERRHHGAFFRPVLLCAALFTLRAVSAFLLEPAIASTLAEASSRGVGGIHTNASFVLTIFGVTVKGTEEGLIAVTMAVAIAAAVGVVACFYFVDTRGRLAVLQCGCCLVALACAFLMVSISRNAHLVKADGVALSDLGWATMLLANASHQLSLGVIPVIMVSELFAVKQRMGAVSLVMMWEAIVSIGLAHALSMLRESVPCPVSVFSICVGIVMACNIAGVVLSWWYIPETSRRSLQDIEAILCGWHPATPRRNNSSHVWLEYGSSE